jgi:hypothetical protein
MASTMELFRGGMFLLVNTIVIGCCILIGGPIFGALTSFISTYALPENQPLRATMIQWIPGFFFTLLIVLEIFLIIRLGYIVVSKTDYGGSTEW